MASPTSIVPPAPHREISLSYRIRRALLIFASFYSTLLLLLYTQQDTLIFASGRSKEPTRAETLQLASDARTFAQSQGLQFVSLNAAGEPIAAFYGTALTPGGKPDSHAASRPTLIWFYGQGNCCLWNAPLVQRYRRHGLNVMIADYVGFGLSGGLPSERGCYAAAEAEYDYLTGTRRLSPCSIAISGGSLGTAVAIDLASRKPCAALITVSAFTNMADMASFRFPIVPRPLAPILLHSRFASDTKIANVRCPILMIHARDDATVPFEMTGLLARAAHCPITTIASPDGGHNKILDGPHARIIDAICRFADQAADNHPA